MPSIRRLEVMCPGRRIRPASKADVAAVAKLHRLVRKTCMPYLPELHTPEEDLALFRRLVFRACQIWVNEGVEIQGFCAFRPGWVDHLYVSPAAQRQGLGSALLNRAKSDHDRLCLWVFQRNTKAIRFYEFHGFVLVERTDGRDNAEGEPDALYAWTNLSTADARG